MHKFFFVILVTPKNALRDILVKGGLKRRFNLAFGLLTFSMHITFQCDE